MIIGSSGDSWLEGWSLGGDWRDRRLSWRRHDRGSCDCGGRLRYCWDRSLGQGRCKRGGCCWFWGGSGHHKYPRHLQPNRLVCLYLGNAGDFLKGGEYLFLEGFLNRCCILFLGCLLLFKRDCYNVLHGGHLTCRPPPWAGNCGEGNSECSSHWRWAGRS